MPRSPRSTRPRAGRLGRSRPAGLPAAAPNEPSSRLLFAARLAPVSAETVQEPAPDVADVATDRPDVPSDLLDVPADLDVPGDHFDVPGDHSVASADATTNAVGTPGGATPPARVGPTTHVHAERLVAVSGKLHLTPSQAVRLASDGRDVLTRVRPRAS